MKKFFYLFKIDLKIKTVNINMQRSLYINISELASYIGQNKWDYITPFERLWKRCDYDGYINILKKIDKLNDSKKDTVNTLNREIKIIKEKLETECDDSKRIGLNKELYKNAKIMKNLNNEIVESENNLENTKLTQEEKIEKYINKDILHKITSDTLKVDEKKKLLRETLDNLKIDDNKNLIVEGESIINKSHGIHQEASAIDLYESKFKVKLDTSQKYHSEIIMETNKNNWYIGGKLDGIYIDSENDKNNYIVEVKNRVKGFFNTLRDYEKTQIHLYMKILKIPNAKLVERYNSKIRVTEIFENIVYTNDIIEHTKIFIEIFEKFLNNPTDQTEYLLLDKNGKSKWIHKKFFIEIYKYENRLLEQRLEDEECYI